MPTPRCTTRRNRGANYQFFSTQMTERVSQRLSTETRLRRALERGEFTLHYQSLVELASGRIVQLCRHDSCRV